MPASILKLICFLEGMVGNKSQLLKKKKGVLGTEGNATAFSMLPA